MASKHCFVTVGATASFHELVKAVLAPPFLKALQAQSYTDLVIQYGIDGKKTYDSAVAAAGSTGVNITGFELDKAGLGRYMRQAKGSGKEAQEGVVISHAGKTSIMSHKHGETWTSIRRVTKDYAQAPAQSSMPSAPISPSSSSRTLSSSITTKSS